MKSFLLLTSLLFLALPSMVLGYEFNLNLSFGSQGSDVLELQKVLNMDPRTQVAQSGPGSPGNETNYFGQATFGAVIRFQELHKEEILTPNGLVYGTGFVGNATRGKLSSAVSASTSSSASAVSSASATPTTSTATSTQIKPLTAEEFIQKVLEHARKSGMAQEDIDNLTEALESEVEKGNFNNPDYYAPASNESSRVFPNNLENSSYLANFFGKTLSFIGLDPQTAEAATGLPFGGAIFAYMYCAESANWMMYVQPLPPSYVFLVSYTTGVAQYPYRNLPYARYVLGSYTPSGVCAIPMPPPVFVIYITTEGTIGGVTGSSL